MNIFNLAKHEIAAQIPAEALFLCANSDNVVLTVQIKDKGYIFCNNNWMKIFKLNHPSQFFYKRDEDFTNNNALVKRYHDYYNQTLELEKTIQVCEYVEPSSQNGLKKMFVGSMCPLYIDSDRPNAFLSIALPENKLLSLSPEGILHLSNLEIKELLNLKQYKVKTNNIIYSFSKKEILCFIALFKGKHAGEIALELNLKQNTVESYIQNLKNKCGVNLKSDLIAFFIEHKILQQIVV